MAGTCKWSFNRDFVLFKKLTLVRWNYGERLTWGKPSKPLAWKSTRLVLGAVSFSPLWWLIRWVFSSQGLTSLLTHTWISFPVHSWQHFLSSCIWKTKCLDWFILSVDDMCVPTHAMADVWRLEDSLQESVLSVHRVDPRDQAHVIKFGDKNTFTYWAILPTLWF